MTTGPKKAEVTVTEMQEKVLHDLAHRHLTPQQIAKRAHVVLLAHKGMGNAEIGRQIGMNRMQVGLWRKRWVEAQERLDCIESKEQKELEPEIDVLLSDEPRPGTPPTFTSEQIVELVALACEDPQESDRPISHWTARELCDEAIKREIVPTISVSSMRRFLK
jgi:transposase